MIQKVCSVKACIRDLHKLSMAFWWFGFRLEPIFATALAIPKIVAHIESGQTWHKDNHVGGRP